MSDNVKLQVLLKAVDRATRPFKAVQAASKTLAGDIRGSQDELKALNAQSRRIEGFRAVSGQLAVTGTALKNAKAETAALALQMRNTANPTAAQVRAFENARRSAAALEKNTTACATRFTVSVPSCNSQALIRGIWLMPGALCVPASVKLPLTLTASAQH